ncbi:hypothetical protein J3F84DRAFT_386002 [Trichoderma pleuroticola]
MGWRGSIQDARPSASAVDSMALGTATDCRDGVFLFPIVIIIFVIYYYYAIPSSAPSDTRLPMALRLGKRSAARCLTRSSHSVPFSSCRYGRLPRIG